MIKSVKMQSRIIQKCEENRDEIMIDYSDINMSIYIREGSRRIE